MRGEAERGETETHAHRDRERQGETEGNGEPEALERQLSLAPGLSMAQHKATDTGATFLGQKEDDFMGGPSPPPPRRPVPGVTLYLLTPQAETEAQRGEGDWLRSPSLAWLASAPHFPHAAPCTWRQQQAEAEIEQTRDPKTSPQLWSPQEVPLCGQDICPFPSHWTLLPPQRCRDPRLAVGIWSPACPFLSPPLVTHPELKRTEWGAERGHDCGWRATPGQYTQTAAGEAGSWRVHCVTASL